MGTEQLIYTNPFNGSTTEITKCKDENRISEEAFKLMLEELEVEDYNEFYILFSNGILVKRGKSKIRTSDYVKNKEVAV
jgi:hypothetical protein